MNIIDVTIRESVYLKKGMTEEKALVYLRKYVELMPMAEVKNVEICFLDNDKSGTLLYNEQFIQNAYEIVKDKYNLTAVLHPDLVNLEKWNPEVVRLFDVVRFMINSPIDEHAEEIIDYLQNLGVKVSINVIYISKKDRTFVDDCVMIAQKHNVKYFCLADSCGGLIPSEALAWIKYLCSIDALMKKNFHFHDHFNMALANALTVLAHVDIIDCSVFGLGKGGGNLNLESIVFANRKAAKMAISQAEIVNYGKLLKFLMNEILEEDWAKALEKYKNLLIGLYNCNLKEIDNLEQKSSGNMFEFFRLISES